MQTAKTVKIAIGGTPCDIQAIAGMIEEAGKSLIEEDHKKLNVIVMVNFQLRRLIDGSIERCINPECDKIISMEGHLDNPLGLACSEECVKQAILHTIDTSVSTLQTEIADLEIRVRDELRENSKPAVMSGDQADRSSVQVSNVSGNILRMKRERLGSLLQTQALLSNDELPMDCTAPGCGEEIPLPAQLQTPEIRKCPACQEAGKKRRQ